MADGFGGEVMGKVVEGFWDIWERDGWRSGDIVGCLERIERVLGGLQGIVAVD